MIRGEVRGQSIAKVKRFMLKKYKMFCRFVVKEMKEKELISENDLYRFGENSVLCLFAAVLFSIFVYKVSPLLFSFCLLQWFGQTVVTVPLTIIMAFVAFDNVKNFVNTLKDTYNDAAKDSAKYN